ncbi:MAG: ribbon-helix-helix domain-containing protein [Nostoc sp.]
MFNPLYCQSFTYPQNLRRSVCYRVEPHTRSFQGSVKDMTSIFGFAIYYYCNVNIITLQMVKVNLNVRVEQTEMEALEAYASLAGRSKTDIIREYIRSLAIRRPPHSRNE